MSADMTAIADIKPEHFLCRIEGRVAVLQLDRPDRKNPLTFESYAELRDWFRALVYADDVDAVVFASNGGNFCSGGDVHSGCGSGGGPRKDQRHVQCISSQKGMWGFRCFSRT